MTQISRLEGRIEVDTAPSQPTRIVLRLPRPTDGV
jgi:chemotaxis protein histidine kinase CheA